jgi:hypothetical protein
MTTPNELHVVHRIMAGNTHRNVLPTPPAGRSLQRIWTLINADLLVEVGPVHNRSAFLEDRNHDWQINPDGTLRFYSRVVETNAPVDIVLDYETTLERDARMKQATGAFDPATGKRLKP